jgi:hypothetical protein
MPIWGWFFLVAAIALIAMAAFIAVGAATDRYRTRRHKQRFGRFGRE